MGIGAFQDDAFQADAFQLDEAGGAFTPEALRNPLFANTLLADLAVVQAAMSMQVQSLEDPLFVNTDVPPHTVQ